MKFDATITKFHKELKKEKATAIALIWISEEGSHTDIWVEEDDAARMVEILQAAASATAGEMANAFDHSTNQAVN